MRRRVGRYRDDPVIAPVAHPLDIWALARYLVWEVMGLPVTMATEAPTDHRHRTVVPEADQDTNAHQMGQPPPDRLEPVSPPRAPGREPLPLPPPAAGYRGSPMPDLVPPPREYPPKGAPPPRQRYHKYENYGEYDDYREPVAAPAPRFSEYYDNYGNYSGGKAIGPLPLEGMTEGTIMVTMIMVQITGRLPHHDDYVVNPVGLAKDDIYIRIEKARAAFASLRHLWCRRDIRFSVKCRVYNAAMRSILL
ncbi:hypothetical protein T265_15666, partial [Opisthorchis viverrini]